MIRTIFALGLCALALCACGLRGDLQRPPPLWGDPPNEGPTDPRTLRAAEDAARAAEEREAAEDAAAEQNAAEPGQPSAPRR